MKAVQYTVRDKDQIPIGISKFHLRENPDGTGVLIINASRILYLNKTATDHIKAILDPSINTEQEVDQIAKKYHVSREKVLEHHKKILVALDVLSKTGDVDPGIIGLQRIAPEQIELTAPLRMDLALTYKCNNNCKHCYAGNAKKAQELTTEQWKEVLKKVFDVQIPQVTFTGGEATLRPDLVELVAATQEIGLVSGLISNGRKLADMEFVKKLYRAGLDHVQITLESPKPEVHEKMTCAPKSFQETVQGIKNCVEVGVFTMTNTTLCPANVDDALDLVEFLDELGVKTFAMNALIHSGKGGETKIQKEFSLPVARLAQTLDDVKHAAHYHGMDFIWYSPTRYCEINPVKMGLGMKTCSACRFNMAIEPDGSVLPCQSWFTSVGNILTDPWEKIWNNELCKKIRDRAWLKDAKGVDGTDCTTCNWSPMCGAACPLENGKRTFLHTECFVT